MCSIKRFCRGLIRNVSAKDLSYPFALSKFNASSFSNKPMDLSNYKGRVGDKILIQAVDDIGLVDVDVTISANDGSQIERGKAVENGVRTGHWIYTATAPVALGSDIFIELVGFDHAGTKAEYAESPRVGEDE
jgi:hypothetical protein